ncbi:MAG: hypothetical protein M1826_004656 [Phylliscum demangeonii]|nr:MAG: hypothetical protein M1826_004656 [Phylliscum demangeonii]
MDNTNWLELSSSNPPPLYIHRSSTSDFPYESSKIKFERLLNFLLLPPQLEQTLWFGALACLDAWLYSFTILPLRFFIALGVLAKWWAVTWATEVREMSGFVYGGLGRMWIRRQLFKGGSSIKDPLHDSKAQLSGGRSSSNQMNGTPALTFAARPDPKRAKHPSARHRRSQSTPSTLLPDHKADLLKGLVVLFSCIILMRFDASRMYHGIRGQAAIKVYVIYNVLEVGDRLLSALGQDVFECLFSREMLERTPDGRSKLLGPFGMFLLALGYNVIHSIALFYQVITLNVAVNSYSNALLTLLMSNQFVEIKSTVFKKFEKENLFQLTCADVVERFQLWLMLLIIAMRNIVEVGGISLGGSGSGPLSFWSATSGPGSPQPTAHDASGGGSVAGGFVVPNSFTIFPRWTGQVFGPFLLVLGSEMLVDWLKHAYVTKFNNTKPAIYGRFLDVLAKDYYSNAFSDQNPTRRLGLPVLPLSCLFIRALVQTYQMFLATHAPAPAPAPSTASSTGSSSAATALTSPTTTAALQQLDALIRRALGRPSPASSSFASSPSSVLRYTAADATALLATVSVFLGAYLVLLALKLLLGMVLLRIARARYRGMKEREAAEVCAAGCRRVGGWGMVEIDADKRRAIYHHDPDGARAARDREKATMRSKRAPADELEPVTRYAMVAKRIW